MGMERRGVIIRFLFMEQLVTQEDFMDKDKPFCIPKLEIFEAYGKVRRNGGSAGIDGQSIASFEENLKTNLYRIWNRMSS